MPLLCPSHPTQWAAVSAHRRSRQDRHEDHAVLSLFLETFCLFVSLLSLSLHQDVNISHLDAKIYLAMLLRYTIENFLSFNGRAVFSMIPGKGSLKKEHRSTPINDISALKASIILGANASGKSNLIKAIDFGRRMVVRGQKDGQILDYKKYRLDANSAEKDSRMEFEIQAAGKNYAYGFVFNNQLIVEEWLYEISRRSQKMIFERSVKSDPIFNLTPMLKKMKRRRISNLFALWQKELPIINCSSQNCELAKFKITYLTFKML